MGLMIRRRISGSRIYGKAIRFSIDESEFHWHERSDEFTWNIGMGVELQSVIEH